MKELMMNEDYSDVTLVTEDKKHIKANVHILSACSQVFKEIFKGEKKSSTIIYLRGIQFSEMESILQFIYLGEATLYEERMDDLFAVAKSLEIKELWNTEHEKNDEPDEEKLQNDPVTSTDKVEHTVTSNDFKYYAKQERRRTFVDLNDRYECEPCQKSFSKQVNLTKHIQSVHNGVKYACDQCDHQATQKIDLNRHIKAMHEGVRYACNQCDYQATQKRSLAVHIQSKHEGITYPCDQCDYIAKIKYHLTVHIQAKHEGVKYACDQCDYQAGYTSDLTRHIQSKHEGVKHACDKCDYQATQKSNLRTHKTNKH